MQAPAKQPLMSAKEIEALLAREFPQVVHPGSGLTIEEVGYGTCRVRQAFSEKSLRPGGTISGPTMMGLADFSVWVAVFGAYGPMPLAVTTNLTINFLRKPAKAALVAKARLLKQGKRLAVGDVEIFSDGIAEPVAHATATYSIPIKA